MSTQIFINLPVKDRQRAADFYTSLGYEQNLQFSDDNAACIAISDDIFVMLLVEDFFKTFTKKDIADASTHTEAILALSAGSREDVDSLVNKALAAGGQASNEANDQGFMYGWGFQDPDGHLWEVIYMDPSAAQE